MEFKLPVSACEHAVLHASMLIGLRPMANHHYSRAQLILGHQPNISHLHKSSYVVQVPIPAPKCTKMEPQRRF